MELPEVILVDIGNSRIKSNEVNSGVISAPSLWQSVEELNDYYTESVPFMISTVRKGIDFPKTRPTIFLSIELNLPIKINYRTKETLGVDRIAAAVGTYYLYPNRNSLIIDMGTCITVDVIDKEGLFQGGVISPGFQMRMQAMHRYTSSLPDISKSWMDHMEGTPAKSTRGSLYNGAYRGIIHELNGFINEFSVKFTSINTILTGGDAHFFESKLKPPIFAASKIVETGLYRIWKHQ